MSNPSQYFICALKCNKLSCFSPWKLLSCWDWPSSSLKNQNSSFAMNFCSKCQWLVFTPGFCFQLALSCLENPMDGGAWWAAVHGVTKSQTRLASSLSLFTFMHWRKKWQPTSVLAWRIPGMGEPGGLPSMGLHRVGHN